MHDSPAISVILPCHDLEGLIGTAIDSLRGQSFTAFEALVIDDGSRDGTRNAALRAIAGDARFRLIASPHRGLSAARNHGLDAARGAMVAFLDGDDSYEPGFLRDHHEELVRSNSPWTASALILAWPDGRRVAHSGIHGAAGVQGGPRWLPLLDACDVAAHFPSAWNKLYRRDFIGATRFREGALYEDHPFFWELAVRARRIRYLPRPLYRYRLGRPGQITAQADGRMLEHLERLREVAECVRDTGMTRQRKGLSRLATRAVDERLRMAPAPAQRARFLNAAGALFAAQGWRWDRAGAPEIALTPAPILDPEMRLGVLLAGTDAAAARETRRALAVQTLPVTEIHAIDAQDLRSRLDVACQARSPWVTLLRAGDCPSPDWAARALEQACRQKARLVVVGAGADNGRARVSGPVACDPAMLLIRRSGLRRFCAAYPARRDALCAMPEPVAMAMLARLLCPDTSRIIALPASLLTLAPRPALTMRALAKALAQTPLAPTERAAIFAHLAQIRLASTPDRLARCRLALAAGFARMTAGLDPPPPAPHIGRSLRLTLWQRTA